MKELIQENIPQAAATKDLNTCGPYLLLLPANCHPLSSSQDVTELYLDRFS